MLMINKKNEKSIRLFCLFILIAGFVYSIVLSFCWGNDPFDAHGTLSLLCEDRKIFFWLWIIIDGGGLFLNINYLYRKYGNAGKIIKAMPVIAMIFAVGIALTLKHDITSWNPKRVAHWAATIGYIVFLVAAVALYAIKNIKGDRIFRILLAGVAAILVLFVAWFVILGKSGMLEMVPRALLEILLLVVNFFVKPKQQVMGDDKPAEMIK